MSDLDTKTRFVNVVECSPSAREYKEKVRAKKTELKPATKATTL
jgi:hypothetical protein